MRVSSVRLRAGDVLGARVITGLSTVRDDEGCARVLVEYGTGEFLAYPDQVWEVSR